MLNFIVPQSTPTVKKNLFQLFHSLLFFFVAHQAISQTEAFDIATFTPPRDWKKETNQRVVTYTNVNTTTGSFCILAIYASTLSLGDPQKDFNVEWKDLVVAPYKAEANPKTETQTTADG